MPGVDAGCNERSCPLIRSSRRRAVFRFGIKRRTREPRMPRQLSGAWRDRSVASSADLNGSGRCGLGDRVDPQAGRASGPASATQEASAGATPGERSTTSAIFSPELLAPMSGATCRVETSETEPDGSSTFGAMPTACAGVAA